MKLGIACDVSSDEMDILSMIDGVATVRTSEIIPFWGDYVVVEVQVFDPKLITSAGDVEVNTHQVRFKAAQLVSKQIDAYVFEYLNSQAVSMGNQPMSDLFAS